MNQLPSTATATAPALSEAPHRGGPAITASPAPAAPWATAALGCVEQQDRILSHFDPSPGVSESRSAVLGGRLGIPPAHRAGRQPVLDELEGRISRNKQACWPQSQTGPRIQELRRKFIGVAQSLDARRLVFIDEAASHNRDDARLRAGASRGVDARVRASASCEWWAP
jgi:hypothetical protein